MQKKNRITELTKYSTRIKQYDVLQLDLLNLKSHENELKEKISLMKKKLSKPLHGTGVENHKIFSKHNEAGPEIPIEDQLVDWSQWLKLVATESEMNSRFN